MCVNVWHECDVDQSMTTSGTFFSPRWDILLKTEFCFLLWNWNCVIWFKKQKPHIKTVFLEHMGRDFNARKSSWKLSSEFIVRHCATGAGASSASDLQRFVSDWSADCTSTSGSWTSTHCRERRHDRWRRLDYTKLLGANFPWAHFFAFAYISPAYVRARGSSSQRRTQADWPELQGTFITPALFYPCRA